MVLGYLIDCLFTYLKRIGALIVFVCFYEFAVEGCQEFQWFRHRGHGRGCLRDFRLNHFKRLQPQPSISITESFEAELKLFLECLVFLILNNKESRKLVRIFHRFTQAEILTNSSSGRRPEMSFSFSFLSSAFFLVPSAACDIF